MADPVFDGATIEDLDVDKIAEGATKLKHLNNAIAEIIKCLQTTFGVEHDTDTGKHTKTFFHETVQLTSAAATTAVSIIPDTDVTDDRKLYVVGFIVYNSGAVAWSGGSFANIMIQDTSDVVFVRIKENGLQAGDYTTIASNINDVDNGTLASTSNLNYTNTAPLLKGEGGTANKGLEVVANALPTTAGTTLYITVWGFIY